MNILVIYGCAPAENPAWPWSSAERSVSIRHLRSADLPERIAEADFVALAVSCGMLRDPWAVVERLLAARNVPMMAFERLDAELLRSIRLSGTCVATWTDKGSVELQCRAQQSAFQRISMSMRGEDGNHSGTPGEGDNDRTTRFVFQGK